MKHIQASLLAISLAVLSVSAQAAVIQPVSYDMLNGSSGAYDYWDDSYSGSGNKIQDGAYLSGGVGDLTDGVVATQNWYLTEAPSGPGPYVGWHNLNPTIHFHFGSLVSIDTIRIYVDDSNGNGGVYAPARVLIGDVIYSINDPPEATPLVLTFSGLDLEVSDLSVTFHRQDQWVFVSEIAFDGAAAAPDPATAWLLGAGLLGLMGIGRRNAALAGR